MKPARWNDVVLSVFWRRTVRQRDFSIVDTFPHLGEALVVSVHELRISPREALMGRIRRVAARRCGIFLPVPSYFLIGSSVHEYTRMGPCWHKEARAHGEIASFRVVGHADWVHLPQCGCGIPAIVLEVKYASRLSGKPSAQDKIQVNLYRLLLERKFEVSFIPVLLYVSSQGVGSYEVRLPDTSIEMHVRTWVDDFMRLDIASAIADVRLHLLSEMSNYPEDISSELKGLVDFLREAEANPRRLLEHRTSERNGREPAAEMEMDSHGDVLLTDILWAVWDEVSVVSALADGETREELLKACESISKEVWRTEEEATP